LRPERAGDEWLIVSCSAVTTVKRVDWIFSALREIAVSGLARIRWVHFGSGPLLADLADRASDAPDGLVIELRGQVENTEVTRFYADNRVDVFVNASASEGVPVSIMEAIAYGIPVVATAVGGTPEIVSPALGSGELVDAETTTAEFASTIQRVATAPAGTYDPRRVWEARYDVRQTAPRAVELVRGLINA